MLKTLLTCLLLTVGFLSAQQVPDPPLRVELELPFPLAELASRASGERAPLLFRSGEVEDLRRRVVSDPFLKQAYDGLRHRADSLLSLPLLTRQMTGRRLLGVSRKALYRNGVLGLVYLLSQDQRYADRLASELTTVSEFEDWNPAHFLDVAEMSLAVAIGLDWGKEGIAVSLQESIKENLYNKGLVPGITDGKYTWYLHRDNNWNQVCHAGMTAAALVLARQKPAAAQRALARAIDGIPYGLSVYGPDGNYPEGHSYWAYGTGFSVVNAELFRTAYGTDFGLSSAPGFLKSPSFQKAWRAPSGLVYSFGDARATDNTNGNELFGWFARETGRGELFSRQDIPTEFRPHESGSRLAALSFTWQARLEELPERKPPSVLAGRGVNPNFVLRDGNTPGFYLGAKGGFAATNHGNMDAGSFVLETDSVRWVIDAGIQSYNQLEVRGINLWGKDQQAERWTLLSKNSENHATLTVNGEQHRVKGFASLESYDEQHASFDMTGALGPAIDKATRSFRKTAPQTVVVQDELITNDSTRTITWRLPTQAEVRLTKKGAVLYQNGRQLRVTILQPAGLSFSVIALDPPPLEYDLLIPNFKRLELRIPYYLIKRNTSIEIKMEGGLTDK